LKVAHVRVMRVLHDQNESLAISEIEARDAGLRAIGVLQHKLRELGLVDTGEVDYRNPGDTSLTLTPLGRYFTELLANLGAPDIIEDSR
jgi:hypothetical protein